MSGQVCLSARYQPSQRDPQAETRRRRNRVSSIRRARVCIHQCAHNRRIAQRHRGQETQRPDPNAASRLAAWVEGLEASFADRILGIDAAIARLWGDWSGQRPRPVVDTLLAATAVLHDLTLVTRNLRDVRGIPVKLLNPWTAVEFRIRPPQAQEIKVPPHLRRNRPGHRRPQMVPRPPPARHRRLTPAPSHRILPA